MKLLKCGLGVWVGVFFCFLVMQSSYADLYSIPLKTLDGESKTLKVFEGKVLLIVNTASRCGYTSQYEGLQKLSDQYREKGFEVLGFPSNDFMGQEPGSNSEIRKFCETNFRVKFPMFEKGSVKGSKIQPLYQELMKMMPKDQSHSVEWNFAKILISKKGQFVKRFRPGVDPLSEELKKEIEVELKKK